MVNIEYKKPRLFVGFDTETCVLNLDETLLLVISLFNLPKTVLKGTSFL